MLQQCSLIIKITINRTINQWVQNQSHTRIPCTSTTINNSRQGHGGNRGLNTQHVMMELKPGVWEDKTKQMENKKWIDDG